MVGIGGGLEADVDVERFDNGEIDGNDDDGDKELGHGKHHKQANCLYVKSFWHH